MGFFETEQEAIQARADRAREKQRDELWRSQCLPKFQQGGLTGEQIDAARRTFCAGFDAGWESHQAFLMGEYIRDNQKKKVHLA
jgi:hypothetical protein